MEPSLYFNEFYREYHGHRVDHLEKLLPALRESSKALIWTAGDSSLDNKYWFRDTAQAVGVYEQILEPPKMKQDVNYWLNYLLCERAGQGQPPRLAAINTAVEATTLNERTWQLRPQDVFIRDNIRPEDILIVSVGGNDVALCPLPCTIASIASMICCLPTSCIEKGFSCGSVPVNDCCCGCGPSLCSCACACPPCLGYVQHLFGTRVQAYISALTAKTKPSKILVCQIYFPDETASPGWAGPALGALGYDQNPSKLQALIRKGFTEATSKIRIQGSQVIPVPLFVALDGKITSDYCQRVEPSPSGGKKMAELLLNYIDHPSVNSVYTPLSPPPSPSYMGDRR
jgi:hypothetical protein